MDIIEFREQLLNDIKNGVAENGMSTRESFLNEVSSILINAEIIDDDIEYTFYEGTGSRNKAICIDGYLYNDLDETLSVFITNLNEFIDYPENLTQIMASYFLKKAVAFITEADYLTKNIEESSAVYELACNINHRFKDIRKYAVYLLTDCLMSKTLKTMEADIINNKVLEYHIIDINRLYEYSMSLETSREELYIDFTQYSLDGSGILCLSAGKTEDYAAYLCNMPAVVLANIYNKYGSRLLEGNVRSFLQTKGKVNKGIRNTILNDPEMFFAYNNGITVTASDIDVKYKNGQEWITGLRGMQIVNGGQTTASLGHTLLNDKKDNSEQQIEKIFVPMKLSIVLNNDKLDELISDIARYANSQNRISDADLCSNHPFHRRIEEFSRRIFAPAVNGSQYGTYWYYERAKGQYRHETYKSSKSVKKQFETKYPKNQMFTKTDLSKYMNIKLLEPYTASAGSQKSFSRFAEWVTDKWTKEQDFFNEQFFKEVIAVAILYRQADKLIRKQPWFQGSYKANIVIYTLSMIIETVKSSCNGLDINYKDIWAKQQLSIEWIKEIEKFSKIIYEFLTSDDRGVENVTEWAKRKACWIKAKESINIELSGEFINKLIGISEQKDIYKAAKKEQREMDKASDIVNIYNMGTDVWHSLIEWSQAHKIFSPKEAGILKMAANSKILSASQSKILLNALNKAREDGFNR